MMNHIRIATRKSKLALWQANFVKSQIENQYPDIKVTLVEMVTEGDRQQNVAPIQIGGKSLFVKALQQALLNDEADIAVHSMKDMSAHETPDLVLAAICAREDARDVFVSNEYTDIASLPANAIVGTSSPRRTTLIRSVRQDVHVEMLRGNVDTRLAKLDDKIYDAIILAAAGIKRLGFADRIRTHLSTVYYTPAIGQGAIGVECRENNAFLRNHLSFLHHENTACCVTAERVVNRLLGGDCHTAIGAHAEIINHKLLLSAMIGSTDGKIILRANAEGEVHESVALGEQVAKDLSLQGAKEYIQLI